jgi:hypothetical protein
VRQVEEDTGPVSTMYFRMVLVLCSTVRPSQFLSTSDKKLSWPTFADIFVPVCALTGLKATLMLDTEFEHRSACQAQWA